MHLVSLKLGFNGIYPRPSAQIRGKNTSLNYSITHLPNPVGDTPTYPPAFIPIHPNPSRLHPLSIPAVINGSIPTHPDARVERRRPRLRWFGQLLIAICQLLFFKDLFTPGPGARRTMPQGGEENKKT